MNGEEVLSGSAPRTEVWCRKGFERTWCVGSAVVVLPGTLLDLAVKLWSLRRALGSWLWPLLEGGSPLVYPQKLYLK